MGQPSARNVISVRALVGKKGCSLVRADARIETSNYRQTGRTDASVAASKERKEKALENDVNERRCGAILRLSML